MPQGVDELGLGFGFGFCFFGFGSDRLFGWTPQPQRFLPFVYVSASRSALWLDSPAAEVLPFVYVSATRLESGEGQKANRGETGCESRNILRGIEVGPC